MKYTMTDMRRIDCLFLNTTLVLKERVRVTKHFLLVINDIKKKRKKNSDQYHNI